MQLQLKSASRDDLSTALKSQKEELLKLRNKKKQSKDCFLLLGTVLFVDILTNV